MSQEDVELVITLFTEARSPEIEMGALMRDEAHWERHRDRFSEDLEVSFQNPSDADLGVMEQEFRGVDGLRKGWRVWMLPWEEFRVTVNEVVDAGNGTVLVLGSAVGKTGAGAEVPQEVASLTRIEDGTVVAVGYYLDHDQARHDAGL